MPKQPDHPANVGLEVGRGRKTSGVAADIARRFAFLLPFLVLLTWFRGVDVYHLKFFERQIGIYLVYNSFRALYSFYLIWLLYYVGSILLRALEKRGTHLGLSLPEEVVLCFSAGAAIASAVAFLVGYLELYYYWILAPATTLLLYVSYRSFSEFVTRVGVWRASADARGEKPEGAVAKRLAFGALIFISVLLFVVMALPPGGGGDYFTHYFPYFTQVVKLHGLAPNELWYHYYVSKGATLVFWSMVLTDPQAPEIVTYAFVLIAGLAVFTIVRRWCGNPVLAMAASVIYLSTAAAPRFPLESYTFGGPVPWGEFQKHHEQRAALLAFLAWLALMMPRCSGPALRAWSLFAALFAAGTVLFEPTAYPFVGVLLGLGALGWAVRKQWQMIRPFGAALATATALLASVLALNYWTTGMVLDTPSRFCWKHADQERFSKLWSPYLMVVLEEGSSPNLGQAALVLPGNEFRDFRTFAKILLRYDHLSKLFFPRKALLILVWLLVGLLLIKGRRPRFDLTRVSLLILGFLGLCVPLSCLSGQHLSAFRYFSFTVFFVNLFGVLAWATLLELLPPRPFITRLACVVPAFVACGIALATPLNIPKGELKNSVLFALGCKSLADGYEYKGGLFGPAVRATRDLPPDTRVYSFSPHICVAPNRGLETFFSYALGKHWHDVMFEPPERAREVLQQQGLNYFLIDLNTTFWAGDIAPYAPLFSRRNLANNLQVAWHERDIYLLTWPGPGTQPLPQSFLDRYGELSQRGESYRLYERVRLIYEANKGKPYPIWRDPALPPVRGWQ